MGKFINPSVDAIFEGFAHESLTIGATEVSLPFASINPSGGEQVRRTVMTVETDQIRYTYDGTTPTSTVGHIANVGDVITLNGYGNARRFLAIRTNTSATLKVTYER